ncbi:hypothetical protein Trydic_g3960 [Trypoxylus dichotomus]
MQIAGCDGNGARVLRTDADGGGGCSSAAASSERFTFVFGITTSEPSAAGQRLQKFADKGGNAAKELETDRQGTPTFQRLAGNSVPTLYQKRCGPNRQDTRATQYKNHIQTHVTITPSATFGEGSQGSANVNPSIQDSLFLWVSVHRHYETALRPGYKSTSATVV